MLKKKERLNKKDFNRFFSSGRKYHSTNLQIIFTVTEDFHGAVVVGKKVYKKAVSRNRLRRQLYNILYRYSREHELKGVYIIITKPTARDLAYIDLKSEFENILKQIKV